MYILIDHIGQTVHLLGAKPLDAAIAFCRYVKNCKPEGGLYPHGCDSAAFDVFRWHVADGTDFELFEMVHMTADRIKQDTGLPRIFEVAIVPRPACWECAYWKGDGAFCERGEQEQSSTQPGCYAWSAPHTAWKDVRPIEIRKSMPRNVQLTEFDKDNFQNLLIEFIEEKGGVATTREMKRRFKRSDPKAVPNALDALIADGWVVRARQVGKRRGRPSELYRLKDAEPPT